MQKNNGVEFKSLLTKEEYEKLIDLFKGNKTDSQTNHYFDTSRFSLKALSASLRVRERESLQLTLKRKKGYSINENTVDITKEELSEIIASGKVSNEEIAHELNNLIGNQKLINFLSLCTYRMYMPYKSGVLFLDKSEYLGVTDYEIEFAASSYHTGKRDFIELINQVEIQYKKSDKKIRRAFNAYKKLH
ncbi:MAG: CYTH domain-containing protein [Bacilli bacterium]